MEGAARFDDAEFVVLGVGEDDVSLLRVLSGGSQRSPMSRDWVERHPTCFAQMTAEPLRPAVVELLGSSSCLPDFLTPPPSGDDGTFDDEVARVATTDARRAAAAFGGSPTDPGIDDRLDRLIGRTRARILRTLATPTSTTGRAAQLHLGIGTIGDHLRVLRDAGVVTRTRTGRRVLYHLTERLQALANTPQ